MGSGDDHEMPERDDAAGRAGRPRAAIVDDEPEVAQIAARAAQVNGFEPVVMASGRELIALVEQACPDVIVLDVVMPDLEGNEILIALRRAGTMPKIILITGYGEAFLRSPSLLAGPALVGTLLKPFREAELGALLRRALSQA
jgi:CheY-like chemotaxis protein